MRNNDKKEKQYELWKLSIGIIEFVLVIILLIAIVASDFSFFLENIFYKVFSNKYIIFVGFSLVLAIVLGIILFPFNFISSYIIERKYGLSNQSLVKWIIEETKSIGIGLPILLLILLVFYAIIVNFQKMWWILFATAMILFSLLINYIAPVIIMPIFYKFEKVGDEGLVDEIKEFCKKMGFKIGNIYRFNLSKTTRKANAGFTGIGKTKRVIIADNLIDNFGKGEILSVIAHEIGHYKLGHIWKNFLFQILIVFSLLFVADQVYFKIIFSMGISDKSRIALLPILYVIIIIVQFIISPVVNSFSRYLEFEADEFVLRKTGMVDSFISSLNKLSEINLIDRRPQKIVEFFFHSHPSVERRIKRIKTLAEKGLN